MTVRHSLLSAEIVAELRATGVEVMAWTVNDLLRAAAAGGLRGGRDHVRLLEVLRFAATQGP